MLRARHSMRDMEREKDPGGRQSTKEGEYTDETTQLLNHPMICIRPLYRILCYDTLWWCSQSTPLISISMIKED